MDSPLENHNAFLGFVDSACSFDSEAVRDLCSAFGFREPDLNHVRSVVFSASFPSFFQQHMAKGLPTDQIPEDVQVLRFFQLLRRVLALFSDGHLDCLQRAFRNFSNAEKDSLLHQLSNFFAATDLAHLGPLCGGSHTPEHLRERFQVDLTICCILSRLLFMSQPESLMFLQRSLPSLPDGEKKILSPLLSCEVWMWDRFRKIFSTPPPSSPFSKGVFPAPAPVPEPQVLPSPRQTPTSRFSISLLEFPSKNIISKKGISGPKPALMLKGDDGGYRLAIVPLLANYDTGEILPKKLKNDEPVPAVTGQKAIFKKLQITHTNIQLGNITPCIQFELRSYPNGVKEKDNYEVFHSVRTEPLRIVSHTTQNNIRPQTPVVGVASGARFVATQSARPAPLVIGEVVPEVADWRGGTRIAILGENFQDNPARVRVKFGWTQVVPEVLGPRTMICYAPRHPLGQVALSVTLDGENWTPDRPFYFTESVPALEEVQLAPPPFTSFLDLGTIDHHFHAV
jgi:hypothetical protein